MEKIRNTKGITLTALIVTIIILLILTGVTLASLTGEKGIIKEAKTAKELAEKAALEEQVELAIIKAEQKYKNPTIDNVIEELKNNKVISKDDQVNKETGAIQTDLGYEITGKLDDYIEKVSVGDGNTIGGGDTPTPPTPTLPTDDSTKPYLPDDKTTVISNNPETGIIIQDSKKNEWVWIEVPKSIYTSTTTNEDYDTIEQAMVTYASVVKGGSYSDTWHSEDYCGLTNKQYTELKQSMLKSVFDNGGFYIGRFEVGTETARFSNTDTLTLPLVQRDKYPYNYITCKQAQEIAKQLKIGNKTSSLMFGIQWDLVMKFLEVKGYLQDGTKVTQSILKDDYLRWGNYCDISFVVNREQALYSTSPSTKASWDTAANYTKPNSSVLLTTGATDRNSVLEIYDLASNVNEWTLEYGGGTTYPCTFRGGDYTQYMDGKRGPYSRGLRVWTIGLWQQQWFSSNFMVSCLKIKVM